MMRYYTYLNVKYGYVNNLSESRSHVLDSSVVSRTSDSTGFSMDSIFGSIINISAEEPT